MQRKGLVQSSVKAVPHPGERSRLKRISHLVKSFFPSNLEGGGGGKRKGMIRYLMSIYHNSPFEIHQNNLSRL